MRVWLASCSRAEEEVESSDGVEALAEARAKGAASVSNGQTAEGPATWPRSHGAQDRSGPYRLTDSLYPLLELPSHVSRKTDINNKK